MSLVGYVRVSSLDQDSTTQTDRVNGAGCDKVFSEKQSGTTTKGRAQLEECLDYMREGDSLVITKIDRLARSARDLYEIMATLKSKGVELKALDQALDTNTPAGKAMIGMMAIFAEFETDIRRERQIEGIEVAKARGVYKGRAATPDKVKSEIMQMVTNTPMTKPAIAKACGVSVATVYKIIKESKQKA